MTKDEFFERTGKYPEEHTEENEWDYIALHDNISYDETISLTMESFSFSDYKNSEDMGKDVNEWINKRMREEPNTELAEELKELSQENKYKEKGAITYDFILPGNEELTDYFDLSEVPIAKIWKIYDDIKNTGEGAKVSSPRRRKER